MNKSKYRDSYKIRGVCSNHTKNPVVEGKSVCQLCLDDKVALIESCKNKGKCYNHPEEDAAVGRKRCQKCLDYAREKINERRVKGVCVAHPGVPAVEGKVRCLECVDKSKLKHASLKEQVFEHYGLKCSCQKCPNPEPGLAFLTIDHVKNDGAEHRKTTSFLYPWLVKNNFPEGFQTLCWNCNCAKGINLGVCPHLENRRIVEHKTKLAALNKNKIQERQLEVSRNMPSVGPKRKIEESMHAELIKLYLTQNEDGSWNSAKKIGEMFSVSDVAVFYILKKNGIPRRDMREAVRNGNKFRKSRSRT